MMTTEQVVELLRKRKIDCGVFKDESLTPHLSWDQHTRPDKLMFLAKSLGINIRKLVLVACDCARSTLHLFPEGDSRPREILECIERWGKGEDFTGLELGVMSSVVQEMMGDMKSNDAQSYAASLTVHHTYTAIRNLSSDSAVQAVIYTAIVAELPEAKINVNICDIIRKHLPWSVIEEHLLKDA